MLWLWTMLLFGAKFVFLEIAHGLGCGIYCVPVVIEREKNAERAAREQGSVNSITTKYESLRKKPHAETNSREVS